MGAIDPLIMSDTVYLVPENKRGLLFGIRATVGSIGWAISPLLGSAVSINYSLGSVFYLIPVFLAAALGAAYLFKRKSPSV